MDAQALVHDVKLDRSDCLPAALSAWGREHRCISQLRRCIDEVNFRLRAAWVERPRLALAVQQEWLTFNASQREAIRTHPDVPWCVECEDWTDTYQEHGELYCWECNGPMLSERPLIHGFTWKTAFYRGALLRISNRLYEQRKAQQQPAAAEGATVTALVVRTERENEDYIRRHFGEPRTGRARRAAYHAGAYQRGQERAADVSLTPRRRLGARGRQEP